MMNSPSKSHLKKERIETLFKECEATIIASCLSAFGLNQSIFTDRDGGNITTLHNFEKDSDRFVHERDKDSHTHANADYNRQDLEVSSSQWATKKKDHKSSGIDANTGKPFKDPGSVDLDHVVPLKKIHGNKKNHLAHNTGSNEGKKKLATIANNNENLNATDSSINRSKGAKTNSEFIETTSDERKKELGVNERLVLAQEQKGNKHIDKEANKALFLKQSGEILNSGVNQASSMAVKQALGLLFTRVTNILFTEIKYSAQSSEGFSLKALSQLQNRVLTRSKELVNELPSVLKNAFEGGISGFISNLLTFLINNIISTIKRLVTIIREGLLGIYKAIKLLLFPPKDMSKEDVWRSAIKIFSTTILVSVITSFTDAIKTFLIGTPFLAPFAEIISTVLVGIISGILSALAAYFIDKIFDSLFDNYNEKMADMLIENSKKQEEIASRLIDNMNSYINNMQCISSSIQSNKIIINKLLSTSAQMNKVKTANDQVLMNNNKIIDGMQQYNNDANKAIQDHNDATTALTNLLKKYNL